MTLVFVYYGLRRRLPDSLLAILISTWLLPAYFSFPSLTPMVWSSVFDNLHVFGVAWVFSLGVLAILLLVQRNRIVYSPLLTATIATGCLLLLFYAGLALKALVHGLVSSPLLATVLYGNLLAVLIVSLYRLAGFFRLSDAWRTIPLAFLALPIFSLFPFLFNRDFNYDFVLSPVSLGLLAFTLIILLLVRRLVQAIPEKEWSLFRTPLSAWRSLLALVLIVYVTGYTFTLLHSILEATLATTLAFLLLGLTALYCFERGAERPYRHWRVLGAVLLLNLVVQFLVIEVWSLPVLWRAVIAIFFAGLFLVGAWYEKQSSATALVWR